MARPPARPNLLLITTDQHNAEVLGCAGNPVVRTPHLDALAGSGVVCNQAFTPFPVCTPARTSIFTGLHTFTHQVRHNVNMFYRPGPPALSPDITAFPELLVAAGYDTALFGKLHARHEGGRNFGLRTRRLVEGKGHFMGSPDEQDEYRRYLLAKGYPPDIWKTWELPGYAEHWFVTSPLPEADYIDTFIADLAIAYLQQVPEPFFAWVSFCTPHNTWDPPEPYASMYAPAEIPLPHRREGELEKKPRQWVDWVAQTIADLPFTGSDPSLSVGIDQVYRKFPEEKVRRMLAAYYGQVTHVDRQVGRLREALARRGLEGNTLVLFTSDHGEYAGNNWAFYKGAGLYDSLVRVPFLVSWPGQVDGGRRLDALVSLIDVAPTLLAAAGVTDVPPMDGFSLLPLLRGNEAGWRQEFVVDRGQTQALVTADWKYVRWRDGTEELYARRDDPHDLDNIAGAPGTQQVMARLRATLGTLT